EGHYQPLRVMAQPGGVETAVRSRTYWARESSGSQNQTWTLSPFAGSDLTVRACSSVKVALAGAGFSAPDTTAGRSANRGKLTMAAGSHRGVGECIEKTSSTGEFRTYERKRSLLTRVTAGGGG